MKTKDTIRIDTGTDEARRIHTRFIVLKQKGCICGAISCSDCLGVDEKVKDVVSAAGEPIAGALGEAMEDMRYEEFGR